MLFGARVVQQVHVENGLAEEHPRVVDVERSDDGGEALGQREAERLQVHLLARRGEAPVDMGQQFAERLPADAAGRVHPLLGEDEAEIVFEPATHGIGRRQRQRFGRCLARWRAALIGAWRLAARGPRREDAGRRGDEHEQQRNGSHGYVLFSLDRRLDGNGMAAGSSVSRRHATGHGREH